MIDFKTQQTAPPQRSDEWLMQRFGKFTASHVADLMTKGRKKDELFGKTAMSYIYQVAAERDYDMSIVYREFDDFRDLTCPESRAMRAGIENELNARNDYEIRHGVEVVEVSTVQHPCMPFLACSPDGLVVESNSGIEIKCPLPKTFMEYRCAIHDAASLKEVRPEYYWQIMCQIACCDLDYVDFVVYCRWMQHPSHEVRIERNGEDINAMLARVAEAENIIQNLLK